MYLPTISSPPGPKDGQLSLLCRAVSLLDMVLRHVSTSDANSCQSRLDRKEVIERFLRSLMNMQLQEPSFPDIALSSSKAICYRCGIISLAHLFCADLWDESSALFLLHSRSLDIDDESLRASTVVKVALSKQLLGATIEDSDDINLTFMIENLYQAAATFRELHIEYGTPESLAALMEIKATLESVNQRWQSAGMSSI